MGTTLECRLIDIPETWRRFYNGPNAGLIDVELAHKEMPWLIGEGASVELSALGNTINTTSSSSNS